MATQPSELPVARLSEGAGFEPRHRKQRYFNVMCPHLDSAVSKNVSKNGSWEPCAEAEEGSLQHQMVAQRRVLPQASPAVTTTPQTVPRVEPDGTVASIAERCCGTRIKGTGDGGRHKPLAMRILRASRYPPAPRHLGRRLVHVRQDGIRKCGPDVQGHPLSKSGVLKGGARGRAQQF